MQYLEIFLMFVQLIQLAILVFLYWKNTRSIKLNKYIKNLPPELYHVKVRFNELDFTRNIKSACANYGLRVTLIDKEKNVFEIIEKFGK